VSSVLKQRRFLSIAILIFAVSICYVPVAAFGLRDGRLYEMTSPVYKGGYGINFLDAVSPDGESVAFGSLGAFEGDPSHAALGNLYVARRGDSKWSTVPVTVPSTVTPFSFVLDFSSTLNVSLAMGKLGQNEGIALNEGSIDFLLHDVRSPDLASNFEVLGETLTPLLKEKEFAANYLSGSADLAHIVVESTGSTNFLKSALDTVSQLYELTDGDAGSPLRLVGLNNKGKVIRSSCRTYLGSTLGKDSQLRAVSADGESIFFTTGLTGEDVERCTEHVQLFVRLGGAKTLEVSRPVLPACNEVPCAGGETRPPAEFQGANESASKVFFTTVAPLATGQDTDTSNDLYMARIECPSGGMEGCAPTQREVKDLMDVTHGSVPADVQGVVTVARDGSRVYFIARGVLTGVSNLEGQTPKTGADNLYVFDSDSGEPPVFVTDLCSGPQKSGLVEDARCPANLTAGEKGRNDTGLWTTTVHAAQLNSCSGVDRSCEQGRFLLFDSYGQLTTGDADSGDDVYRYDADSGVLERVSIGESGYDANGNDDRFDATVELTLDGGLVTGQYGLDSRAITEDGSRVVFTTAEPLSPQAGNGLVNAYEWRQQGPTGDVRLVSTGSSDQPVEEAVMSSSGRDVFFRTTQGLVSQDTDGQFDVYDARLETESFPIPPTSRKPCTGDGCQGPLTNPAPLLVPGSVSQTPGGNYAAPVKKHPVKVKKEKRKKRAKKRGRRSAIVHAGQGGATKGRNGR
jgi:hypothetical protein